MFSWLGGRSRRSACTQVHWETKSMYLFACCGPGATHVRQLLQITLHRPADTICKVCQQIALHPTCAHNCYNLRETDPCDHSATYVADQVRHTCDPCATTMRHPLVPFSFFLPLGPAKYAFIWLLQKKPCPKQNRSHANFLWISSPAHLWFSWADPWSYTLVVACF